MIYAYKTTNIINGKYYIGVHKSYIEGIDNYIGCGIRRQSDANKKNRFHTAVRKYGYENFKVEILKTFNSYEEALLWEQEYITDDYVKDTQCYNSKKGGRGGGYIWSEERKEFHKKNKTYSKSEKLREKLSAAAKKRFESQPGTFTGRTHSEETRQILSLQRKGISKGKGRKLNLSDEQRLQKRLDFMENAHKKAIIANKRFSSEIEEEIRQKYTGRRGQKVVLAKEYNCHISMITNIVGKSFTHNKKDEQV